MRTLKLLMLSTALVALGACRCGPGVSCRADGDCGGWGVCGAAGYCTVKPAPGGEDGGADAGVPSALVSVEQLDLGLVGCGTTSTSGDLDVINTGSAPLTFETSVGSSSLFRVTPGGQVAPGGRARVTVTGTPPADVRAGTDLGGTLTITTNDAARRRLEVPLTLKASGVTLVLTPALVSFGVVPLSAAAPQVPLTLTNTGDLPATVSVGAPGDAQFSVSWTGAPAPAVLQPGQSVAGLAAGFAPTRITPSSAVAGLQVAEPVCGVSAGEIPMTGQGTNGVVGISTTDVFFGANGLVDCGTRAGDRTIALTNGGNQAFSWTATLGKGASSPFTVTPGSGTVPAGAASVTITVSTTAVPARADTRPEAFGDVLTVVTDAANDTSHPITLHQTARGAVLGFAPASVDFGSVPVQSSASAPFSVVNGGSAPARVSLASDNPAFALSAGGPTQVAPGQTGFTATFSPGGSVTPQSAAVSLAVDPADVLCAPLPAALALSGTGTSGSVSYSPVALDFGLVDCGATAAAQTVTFRNAGNQSYTVNPALGRGASSPYALSMSPATGAAAADGGTVVITVTPVAIPQASPVTPDLYGDVLTVATDVTGDPAHDIPLRQTARGAVFAMSASSIDFGTVPVGVAAGSQFSLTNTGNAGGALSFVLAQPTIFNLPASVSVAGGGSAVVTGTFTPQAATGYSDTASLSVSASTVLCQPLPVAQLTLAGAGSASNVVAVTPSSLTLGSGGLVPCGTQASARTVRVTNSSSQVLALAYALAGGAGSPYSVTGPGTVGTGATVTVTVTPAAIPATASTAADAFADTLTITATGGPVNEAHTVALHQTAQGAVLSFNPAALSFTTGVGGSQTKSFTVNNTGNLAAPYTLTVGGADPGNFSVNPTSATAGAAGSAPESATFNAPLLGTRSATVSLATSATRCAPLPAPLALSGQVN